MKWNDQQHAKIPKKPPFWRCIFDPKHTYWGGGGGKGDEGVKVLEEKWEAFCVLFLENAHFLKGGGTRVARQYMEWCDQTMEGDYRLESVRKAKGFLEYRVHVAQEHWYEDMEAGAERRSTVEECAMNAFRSAICHLNSLAQWQGYPLHLLENEQIRVMRDRMTRMQNVARAAPRDYAGTSRFLTKRLTQDEMDQITTSWWDGSAAEQVACTPAGRERGQVRGLLFHCLQKSIGRRGDELRNLRNAMLFLHELKHTNPVSPCTVIGASLRHVKEYSENTEHLIGWVRSKDRMACPVGALACYFAWMIDIAHIPILEEIRRDIERGAQADRKQSAWWKRMLFVTDTQADLNEMPMSYATHHKSVHAGFDATGTQGKSAATHIYRSTLACDTLETGVPFLDVGVYQGWYHDNAADVYLRGAFKSGMLLRANGWVDDFACWWEGKSDDIPSVLQESVFRGLDELLQTARRQYEETQRDRSSVEFLRVLQYLRKVFIEDAVEKRMMYPNFAAYVRHPIFHLPEWPEYCEAQVKREQQRARDAVAGMSTVPPIQLTDITTAVREVLSDVFENGQPNHKRGKKVPQENAPIEMPNNMTELPEIPEPTCLYTCYQVWQQHRSYFYSTPLPPWKKRFGERAATMKLRYSRMRPFLMYLDRSGASARRALDVLEAFRSERKVMASVFIKQCFYHLEFTLKDDCRKPPPILPHELRARMEREGIPPF
jgi:hypothetical protein